MVWRHGRGVFQVSDFAGLNVYKLDPGRVCWGCSGIGIGFTIFGTQFKSSVLECWA